MIFLDVISYAVLFWWSTSVLHIAPEPERWDQVAGTVGLVGLKVFALCGVFGSAVVGSSADWWARGLLYAFALVAAAHYCRKFDHVRLVWAWLNRTSREPHP